MVIILALILFVFVVVGTLRYNELRQNWAHVMGVFGSYVIFAGVLFLVQLIGSIVLLIMGNQMNIKEMIVAFVFMLVCLGYAVLCMMKCRTMKERIMLPFVACMIGAGFCWRLLGSLILHIPMSHGASGTPDGSNMNNLPPVIYDADNNPWHVHHYNIDSAGYCNDAGQMVVISHGKISGTTVTSDAGTFHW